MLVVSVERYREQAAGLPLKALFVPVVLPHAGGAASFENVIKRLVNMPLRIEILAGRDSDDVSIVEIARAVEHNVDAVTAHTVPPFEWKRVKVLHEEPANHIDALGR